MNAAPNVHSVLLATLVEAGFPSFGITSAVLVRLTPVVARLIAEAEERGAARVRERVEAVADWCAAKEADMRASIGIDGYSEGARDAYDVTESRIRAALTDEAQLRRYCSKCDGYTDHVSTAHDGLAARGLVQEAAPVTPPLSRTLRR